MGFMAGGGLGMLNIVSGLTQLIRTRRVRASFVLPSGLNADGDADAEVLVVVRRTHLDKTMVEQVEAAVGGSGSAALIFTAATEDAAGPWRPSPGPRSKGEMGLDGDQAMSRSQASLVSCSRRSTRQGAASKASVARAVCLLEPGYLIRIGSFHAS